MEKICSENIISSLFIVGFDKVDSLLFTLLLGYLSQNKDFKEMFEYDDREFSKEFKKYIVNDASSYRLKDGYTLDTTIKLEDVNVYVPLEKALRQNKKLTLYLENMDFTDVIEKKDKFIQNFDGISNYLTSKEKEIIKSKEKVLKVKKGAVQKLNN